MSNESAARNRATIADWLTDHRHRYLTSGGRDGHIEDMTDRGGHALTTHCMIKYTGRKSGKTFITPLIYGAFAGEVVVVGSKGGDDVHPGWYLSIRGSKEIEFQIGTQAFRGTLREPSSEERDRIWAFMVETFPPYANYQASTGRQIPLIMMKPLASIDVFREDDVSGES